MISMNLAMEKINLVENAAGAKSLISSYVDAGHDTLCAEDIYAALHYGNGMKNSAIAVA